MYTGGAGGYSFYVRGGEQVVRQRRNNSNYGESASRTEAQMLRRVKWGNLVNVYKAMSSWQPKAYEFKAAGQTDYNIFMSMNINSASCALTKDMANNGCAVQEGFWVSRGSLPPIERAVTDPSGGIGTSIKMTITPSASTTVGQFSANILENNPLFQAGDNLAFIMFSNFKDNRGYPYLTTSYAEVTLDASDTTLLQSSPMLARIIPGDNTDMAFRIGALGSNESGLVIIRTRRESGVLKVSSQSIWGTGETLIDEFSGQDWIQTCVVSYGLDGQVPLDPGGGEGGVVPGQLDSVSYLMTGAGSTAITSPTFSMRPGRYSISVTPSLWYVDNISSDAIVLAVSVSTGQGTFTRLYELTKEDLLPSGFPSGVTVEVPSNANNVFFNFRADEGVSAIVSLRRS